MDWDDDINEMSLTSSEKDGLQLFRNYQNSFEKAAVKKFAETITVEPDEFQSFASMVDHISREDVRFLAVISCSFCDDHLISMYKREIRSSVPGGISTLLNGFGSLSSFSQRLQIAHAFELLSLDLLVEIDKLRKIRNSISHSWDINKTSNQLQEFISSRMEPIEMMIDDRGYFKENFWATMVSEDKFRFRLIWMLGRFYYECKLFARVKRLRLPIQPALYSEHSNVLLSKISKLCLSASNSILTKQIQTQS